MLVAPSPRIVPGRRKKTVKNNRPLTAADRPPLVEPAPEMSTDGIFMFSQCPATPQQGQNVMANPFVHIELMATDVGKARAFYGKLFDWKLEDMPMGDMTYTMIKVGEGTGGGMLKNPMPNVASTWVPYVDVGDLAAATAKAKSLGATVHKENVAVGDHGIFSIISDPTGALLGLWQQK
jgi:uncharacterized protein